MRPNFGGMRRFPEIRELELGTPETLCPGVAAIVAVNKFLARALLVPPPPSVYRLIENIGRRPGTGPAKLSP